MNGERDFISVLQICKCIDVLGQSKIEGIVNIGTGKGSHLLTIVKRIAQLLDRQDLIISAKSDNPTFHVANIEILESIGVKLESSIDSLLFEMTR